MLQPQPVVIAFSSLFKNVTLQNLVKEIPQVLPRSPLRNCGNPTLTQEIVQTDSLSQSIVLYHSLVRSKMEVQH